MAPCAVQWDLVAYLFHIYQCVSVDGSLLIYPSPTLFPIGNLSLFFCILLLFCIRVHLYHFFKILRVSDYHMTLALG